MAAILELSARGRAKLTVRVEEVGVVLCVVGASETRGVRDARRAQEWAEAALQGLLAGGSRSGDELEAVKALAGSCATCVEEVMSLTTEAEPKAGAAGVPVAGATGTPAGSAALVNHSISCKYAPGDTSEEGQNGCVKRGDEEEAKAEPSGADYTLHILCDVIDITISVRGLERCE